MPADLSDPLFFSALLEGCKSAINEIVKGKSNYVHQKGELTQLVDSLGYRAAFDKFGTMEDLRSDVRLNLVLNTNVSLARCFRQWQEMNHPDSLIAFPAQELFRVGRRKVSRDWHRIWDEVRNTLPGTSALESSSGRLAALKHDPIWYAISDFGFPWPPFKYGSGMGLMNIDYDEAVDLGLMTEEAPVPKDQTFQLNVPDRTPDEPPATPEQITAIQGMVRSITGSDMANLGSKQASFLIDEITRRNAQFTQKEPPELATPLLQIIPDFERILILTLGDIDPASLPPSWN
jgi:hypothetical protein